MSSSSPSHQPIQLVDLLTSNPSPVEGPESPTQRPGVKITCWRLTNTIVLLSFAIAKGVLAYRKKEFSVTTIDLVVGVLWTIIAFWFTYIETEAKHRFKWFFQHDARAYVGLVDFPISNPLPVEGSESSTQRPGVKITCWRVTNTIVLLSFAIAKGVLAYRKKEFSVNTIDIIVGVLWTILVGWFTYIEMEAKHCLKWFFQHDSRAYIGFVGLLVSTGVAICVGHYWTMHALHTIIRALVEGSDNVLTLIFSNGSFALAIIAAPPVVIFLVVPAYLRCGCVRKYPNTGLESENWVLYRSAELMGLDGRRVLWGVLAMIWQLLLAVFFFTNYYLNVYFICSPNKTAPVIIASGIIYVVPFYLLYVVQGIARIILQQLRNIIGMA